MPSKLVNKLLDFKIVRKVIRWSKKIVLPGFDGIPLFEVLTFLIKGLQESSLTTRAAALAFRFFLALFPALIFLLSLLPYIPIDDFYNNLLVLMEGLLPDDAYEMAKSTIDDLVHKRHDTLLSLGFILAIYFASDGVNSMIEEFNHSYHSLQKSIGFIKQRLTSLLILGILTLLMVLAILLMVFYKVIINYLITNEWLSPDISLGTLGLIKMLTLLILFFTGISSVYYFGNLKGGKFRFMSAGSTLATGLAILISAGFGYYVNNFASYNKIYGSIGTLIVVLLWLYFNSLVLLIGYELNVSIAHAKNDKKIASEEEINLEIRDKNKPEDNDASV
ncbi:MAG TPA: YihY/virulence factor BrkB family protein [Vicingaceae bacterium]|jgi:membrane protein|nr:YihY/virulence factor BrkB family protein [Vicingaceae bacterium]